MEESKADYWDVKLLRLLLTRAREEGPAAVKIVALPELKKHHRNLDEAQQSFMVTVYGRAVRDVQLDIREKNLVHVGCRIQIDDGSELIVQKVNSDGTLDAFDAETGEFPTRRVSLVDVRRRL